MQTVVIPVSFPAFPNCKLFPPALHCPPLLCYAPRMRRFFATLLCMFMIVPVPLGCAAVAPEPRVDLYALDIGKADCMLLTDGAVNVLIDTGEKDDAGEIFELLWELDVETLDLVVLTHFDKDHMGSMAELAGAVEIKEVRMPGYVPDRKSYRKMLDALYEAEVPVERVRENQSLTLGSFTLDFDATSIPYSGEDSADNDQSLILRVTGGKNVLLFTGDAKDLRTEEYLSRPGDKTCTVLKMPWHGAMQESSAALLDAAKPAYAVITDSEKNPADDGLLSLLGQRNITVLRTAPMRVHLALQGDTVTVED